MATLNADGHCQVCCVPQAARRVLDEGVREASRADRRQASVVMSGGLARAEVEANSIYPNWQRVASGVTAQCPSITTALWKHKYSPHMQAEVWLGGLSRVQWIDRRDCVCVCKCMGSPSLQLLTADKVPTVQSMIRAWTMGGRCTGIVLSAVGGRKTPLIKGEATQHELTQQYPHH